MRPWSLVVLVACSGGGSQPPVDDPDGAPPAPDADLRPPAVCELVIDCDGAEIPDEPKLGCALRIEDGRGEVLFDGPAGIERRGRSSQAFPKPQYSVELRDAGGAEAAVNLFAMGAESDWILNGMYIDRALFRNRLFFDLFQSLGGAERYAPETRYCALTLDGDWRGLYLLTERVKRDDDRIPIGGDQGVGASFVLKQDEEGFHEIQVAYGFWSLVYPHRDLATDEQRAGVSAWLDGWRAAVQGGGADLFSLVDLDSAVDFVLLQEFVKGNDAYFLSMHVWKEVGGLLHFTPWDIDLSLGQPLYNDSTLTSGWIVHRPALIQAMADDPRFQARLVDRWAELRAGPLTQEAIDDRIDSALEIIADQIEPNFERWPIEEIQFLDNQLYPVSSHGEELSIVRAWIPGRLAWIDANIAAYGNP
jgi:hypothetical protein